ncbi:MAG TPA: MBL fold metallo-hydrolase [Candidatus Limnocylindria bacterium]|jgi:glyoxylase-like metal-dependent hydrolase (beta-lactamase superfamily II)|nr:MBL fold metallo-hydrolase [Candidatus Limnocylindria bacterium]
MRICDTLALVGSLQLGLSGPFDCHVYAMCGSTKEVVLIDSGAGTHTERLLQHVAADLSSSTVAALLITHCHADHCGGAAAIREQTGCRVIAPQCSRNILETGDEEASGLRVARDQGLYPMEFRLRPCAVDEAVQDGDVFTAAGTVFTAIHVRGHSRDSFCFLTKGKEGAWMFTGDSVFYGGVLGVINADGSGMEGYRSDLHKLEGHGVQGFFPGHGLFTLSGGQRHLDCAVEQVRKGFLGRQIGQGDLFF